MTKEIVSYQPTQAALATLEQKYKGVVFATMIQSIYGQLPIDMLKELGFTETMIRKIPTLFGKRGW